MNPNCLGAPHHVARILRRPPNRRCAFARPPFVRCRGRPPVGEMQFSLSHDQFLVFGWLCDNMIHVSLFTCLYTRPEVIRPRDRAQPGDASETVLRDMHKRLEDPLPLRRTDDRVEKLDSTPLGLNVASPRREARRSKGTARR